MHLGHPDQPLSSKICSTVTVAQLLLNEPSDHNLYGKGSCCIKQVRCLGSHTNPQSCHPLLRHNDVLSPQTSGNVSLRRSPVMPMPTAVLAGWNLKPPILYCTYKVHLASNSICNVEYCIGDFRPFVLGLLCDQCAVSSPVCFIFSSFSIPACLISIQLEDSSPNL